MVKNTPSFTGFFNIAGGNINKKPGFEVSKIVGSFKKFVESQAKNSYDYVAVLSYREDRGVLIEGESKSNEEDGKNDLDDIQRIFLTAAELRTLCLVGSESQSTSVKVVSPRNEQLVRLLKLKSKTNSATVIDCDGINTALSSSCLNVYVKSKRFNTSTINDGDVQIADGAEAVAVIMVCKYDAPIAAVDTPGTATSINSILRKLEDGLSITVRTIWKDKVTNILLHDYLPGMEEYVTVKDNLTNSIQRILKQVRYYHQLKFLALDVKTALFEIIIDQVDMAWFQHININGIAVPLDENASPSKSTLSLGMVLPPK